MVDDEYEENEIGYTIEDWPGYFGTYTILNRSWGEDGYGLDDEDITILEALGYKMTFEPKF